MAQKDLEGARKRVQAADDRLKGQMARLAPAMTGPQQEAYIKAYHDKYKGAYQAEAKAASALKKALENPALGQDKETLKSGYTELAQSSQAKAALNWAQDNFKRAGSALYHDKALADIAGKAVTTIAADVVADADSPLEGVAKLKEELKPFLAAKGVNDSLKGLEESFSVAEEAAKGKYDRLESLATDWTDKSGLMKSIAVIGVVAGAASATTSLRKGKYEEAIGKLASTGQSGLALLAGVTGSIANSGEFAERLGANAAKVGKILGLAGRFIPALGAVAASAAFNQHASQEQNAGTVVAMLGDMLSFAGSIAEASPGAPVGFIVNAMGSVLSAIGDSSSEAITRSARQQEEKELMATANRVLARKGQSTLPQDIIDEISNPDSRADRLGELKLSPSQVQRVILDHKHLIENGDCFEAITRAARALGVPPYKFNDFVKTLAGHFGDELNAGIRLQERKSQARLSGATTAEIDREMRNYLQAIMPTEMASLR